MDVRGISLLGDAPGPDGGGLDEATALAELQGRLFGTRDAPRLSRYRLLRRLGAGGRGVVYLARDPELDRDVAIKLLQARRHADDAELARFVREAQAMAMLSDPHVVQVFDVGRYDDGDLAGAGCDVPVSGAYIVMEYVAGLDLQRFVDGHNPRPAALVELFVAAGRGVAAAHRAGLVHRDFKPQNVMVGDDGRVRVLDLGLAALMGDVTDEQSGRPSGSGPVSGDDALRLTRTGMVMGTPAFMAPEQHLGQPADARSDQFGFCAALCQCLSRTRMFSGANLEAIYQSKLDVSVSPIPGVPPRVIAVLRRGLRADPADRFPSMDALLAALVGRPARVRLGLVAGIATAAIGVGAAVVSTGPGPCEAGASAQATQLWSPGRRDRIHAALGAAGPDGHEAARKVVAAASRYAKAWRSDYAAACVAERPAPRRLRCLRQRATEMDTVLSALESADATVLPRAGRAVTGVEPPAACMRLPAQESGYVDPAIAQAVARGRDELARAQGLQRLGRLDAAAQHAEAALGIGRNHHPPLTAEALARLGYLYERRGDHEQALQTLRQGYFLADEIGHHEAAARAATVMVHLLATARADLDGARDWIRHAEAALARADRPPRLDEMLANTTAIVHAARGDHAAAASSLERALASHRTRGEPDGWRVAAYLDNLANSWAALGRHEEALDASRRALTIRQRELGPSHRHVANSLSNLGSMLSAQGRHGDALPLLRRALTIRVQVVGDAHPEIAISQANLATALVGLGRAAQAREHYRAALRTFDQTLGPDHPHGAVVRLEYGTLLAEAGEPSRARPLLEQAARVFADEPGPQAAAADYALGHLELSQGNRTAASDRFAAAARRWRSAGVAPAELLDACLGWAATSPG